MLLALIIWVYVSSEQNPVTEKEINVALENTGLAQNYLITAGLPESIRVKVHGNQTQLSNLSSSDFQALVNIPEGETGTITLPVEIAAPPGLRVVQVYPSEVDLTVDSLVEKMVPVVVNLLGDPPRGYAVQTPLCQPDTVMVSGPSKAVAEVTQATAVVNVDSATQDIALTLTVSTGNLAISLSPAMVRVTVPVSETGLTKSVSVQPHITGIPATGFEVKSITSEPAAIQVAGPAETVEGLSEVQTVPVDISGLDKDLLVQEVDLLSLADVVDIQPNQVTVRIEVGKVEPPTQLPASNSENKPQEP